MTEDRISALPNDLLVTILMSLPTKDAINTMILSKRWLFLWTMLPTLAYDDDDDDDDDDDEAEDDFDDDDDDDDDIDDAEEGEDDNIDDDDGKTGDGNDDDESKKSVWGFLNKSMELHKAPLLAILTIKLGPLCPTDANICKWLETAVNRGVRELNFELQWSADPTRLPENLYMCKTIVRLELCHKILVDFPSSSCLPSLTQLALHYVVYKDEDSLVTFLSSCPVLDILWVRRKEEDNVSKFTVKLPSLQVLWYDRYRPLTDEYDEVDNGRSLVVDTPALRKFCITNYSRDSFSIESLPCLEYASIDGKYVPETDSDRFLKSLSNVLSLDLILTDEMALHCSNIKFPRVIKCWITPRESDWMDSLVLLLENTPKLKHLIVDYGSTSRPPKASATWMIKGRYGEPECLSSSLEKFKVIKYKGREEEQELVEYILENSKCLKKTTISFKSTVKHKDTKMEELKAFPRVSIGSHLVFRT